MQQYNAAWNDLARKQNKKRKKATRMSRAPYYTTATILVKYACFFENYPGEARLEYPYVCPYIGSYYTITETFLPA